MDYKNMLERADYFGYITLFERTSGLYLESRDNIQAEDFYKEASQEERESWNKAPYWIITNDGATSIPVHSADDLKAAMKEVL